MKPQIPAFLHPFSGNPALLAEFCTFILFLVVLIPLYFITLEKFFPVYGIVFTMLAVIAITFFVIVGNIFQYIVGTDVSQDMRTKNILKLIAIERTSLLKVFLELNLIVNIVFCIYTFCTDCSAVAFFILFYYPVSVFIAITNFYYTFLNVKTWFFSKIKLSHESLGDLQWIVPAFGVMVPAYYCDIFIQGIPFYSYFLLFSVTMAYALLLNKFGNYPFIDYELFDPNYVCVFSSLCDEHSIEVDICQFCEFTNECTQHCWDEYCCFGSDEASETPFH